MTVTTLLLALGGCSGVDQVNQTEVSGTYTAAAVSDAVFDRDLKTVVIGDPFATAATPVAKPAFDQAVVDLLTSAGTRPATHYTTTPGATAKPDYRIVLAFNTAAKRPAGQLCMAADPAASETVLAPPPGTGPVDVSVQAALCHGGGAMTAANGVVSAVSGPDAPGFRHLLWDVGYSLFPVNDSRSQGGPCGLSQPC